MDRIKLRIPAAFVLERTAVSWRDVQYGLENELLDPTAPIDVAIHRVGAEDAVASDVLELAGSSRSDSTLPLVLRLAALEPMQTKADLLARWSYLVLAWVYCHRAEFTDPLQLVEEVYADFEYPAPISEFVRYMPDADSAHLSDERLMHRWKQYLEECDARFRDGLAPP